MKKYVDEEMLELFKQDLGSNIEINLENQELLREVLLFNNLEYLETDGAARIQTNYYPNSNTKIICKAFIPVNSSNSHLFGARTSTSSLTYTFSRYENKCYRSHYGNSFIDFDDSIVYSTPFILEKNKNS